VTENARGTAEIASETKEASSTVAEETTTLAQEIRTFLSSMRQGMFDRRRQDDPTYTGTERRSERRGGPEMRRQQAA
jgi:hypothetical protein